MPRVRVHQHVNPLSPFYRQQPSPVVLTDVFAEAERPLLIDIGCARGRFLLRMSEVEPSWNYLGVEIREPLVTEANEVAIEHGRTNLHYAFCNAMLWLGELISEIPSGGVRMVTIQFPDPWFKKKHAKRRMVNPEMVATIMRHLAPNGRIFVQTDIEFLAQEMFGLFRGEERLQDEPLMETPFPVKSEREKAVEAKGLPIYRALFVRRS
jgi:tRNA (guanine-N7-)-methyltransferase